MPLSVRDVLDAAAYYPIEIEKILDEKNPSFLKFDPVLGYVIHNHTCADGVKKTISEYSFEKHGGHRKVINYAANSCRINTYGNSFTMCAQVSDGETWQEILAAHLREPMRNFGIGGYGVYQAYRKAMQVEVVDDLAAEYIILNVWEDDHMRNIDAARWNRVGWMCRDLPRGKKEGYPVHGFPWAHVRYDLDKNGFVECPGLFEQAEELRTLVGKEEYYEMFKDDPVVHLYALTEGGDAPIDQLENIAKALGEQVDLRTPATRQVQAQKLHYAYGMRSTEYIIEKMKTWADENNRKLMVFLTYDAPSVMGYIEKGTRFDSRFVEFLETNNYLYVDLLRKFKEEYQNYSLDLEKFVERFYVERAGVQVFGHYNPYGNFWFATGIKDELVDWLNPKPPAYRQEEV